MATRKAQQRTGRARRGQDALAPCGPERPQACSGRGGALVAPPRARAGGRRRVGSRGRPGGCPAGHGGRAGRGRGGRARAAAREASPAVPDAPETYRAVLDRYCVACHNERTLTANLALDAVDIAHVGDAAELWEKVLEKLRTRAMPPPRRPRPADETYDRFAVWLETELDGAAAARPDPGRPTIHRLNRLEYRNAVRDLLGLAVDVDTMLPADDLAFGFDNNADILTIAPGMLERYMSAARRIGRLAVGDSAIDADVVRHPVSSLLVQRDRMSEEAPFGSRGGAAITHHFPLRRRVRRAADAAGQPRAAGSAGDRRPHRRRPGRPAAGRSGARRRDARHADRRRRPGRAHPGPRRHPRRQRVVPEAHRGDGGRGARAAAALDVQHRPRLRRADGARQRRDRGAPTVPSRRVRPAGGRVRRPAGVASSPAARRPGDDEAGVRERDPRDPRAPGVPPPGDGRRPRRAPRLLPGGTTRGRLRGGDPAGDREPARRPGVPLPHRARSGGRSAGERPID